MMVLLLVLILLLTTLTSADENLCNSFEEGLNDLEIVSVFSLDRFLMVQVKRIGQSQTDVWQTRLKGYLFDIPPSITNHHIHLDDFFNVTAESGISKLSIDPEHSQ